MSKKNASESEGGSRRPESSGKSGEHRRPRVTGEAKSIEPIKYLEIKMEQVIISSAGTEK